MENQFIETQKKRFRELLQETIPESSPKFDHDDKIIRRAKMNLLEPLTAVQVNAISHAAHTWHFDYSIIRSGAGLKIEFTHNSITS